MSNKLKRKLDQSAADPGNNSGTSGNLLESFVQYGTALPSLEKKDKNEYVPVWQQTVTDDQGRRRLHGAFTGGFSAGYFNSVGSAEGWTPSNFVSSRNNRAKYSQSAKDFMDDEDLADAKDEQVNEVSQDPSMQQQKQLGSAESAGEDKLISTIRGAQDRAGHALLKKMGWREGQGAGPRLSAQARQRMAVDLGLGRDEEHDWTATAAPGQTFAPLDRPLVHFQAKDNQYGLGYTAAMRLDEDLGRNGRGSSDHAKLRTQEGNTSMPVGGAFGISALEDADDDDYSVYEGASSSKAGQRSSKLSRMMEEDEDQPRMTPRQPTKQRHAPELPKTPGSSQTYLDNTPILPGFSMSRAAPTPDSWFAPPSVPKDWTPDPKRVMALAPSSDSNAPSSEVLKGQPPPKLDARGKPVLSADDRAAMLSDAPAKARSVFDFISKKNQERISAAKAAGQKVSEPEPEPARPQVVELEVPELEKNIAQAALKGFMPYGDDLNKQARYRLFLQAAAGLKEDEGVFRPKAEPDRVEELNKELADFKKSAMVFKPMSKAMASRFTGSSSVATAKDMAQPGQPGLAFVSSSSKSDDKSAGEADEAAPAQASNTETDDPVINAVRMGMFGALTRRTSDFCPNKLLCKRFGVRQPHPEGPSNREDEENDLGAGPDDEKDLLNKATMEELRKQSGYAPPVKPVETSSSSASTLAPSTSGGPNKQGKALGSVGLGEDETQGQDILTYERPPMDLFKAIFADSDDEDEQDDENVAGPSKAEAEQQSELARIVTAPPSAATKANLEPVSFADFKPTFVRRPQQEASTVDKPKTKKKKDKKSKGKGATLSFEIDDGEGAEEDGAAPKLQKEKRKKSSKSADGEEDSNKSKKAKREKQAPIEEEEEWVEKEVAPTATATATAPAPAPARARARAADLF